MADLASVDKARRELEELYIGVPDESVNLTFKHLAQVNTPPSDTQKSFNLSKQSIIEFDRAQSEPSKNPPPNNNNSYTVDVVQDKFIEKLYVGVPDESVNFTFKCLAQVNTPPQRPKPNPPPSDIQKSNFEFNRVQPEPPKNSFPDNNHCVDVTQDKFVTSPVATHEHHHRRRYRTPSHDSRRANVIGHAAENSTVMGKSFDNCGDMMSQVSGVSIGAATGQRRPGIPHSNICTICTTYIYLFRHRCLVCGRVYCRQCVRVGMGEMAEGRKCLDCLGRRFSPRYIQIAGQIGCFMGYTSTVKQQELKWAEIGPRVRRKSLPGLSSVISKSRSPAQMTPKMAHSPTSTPSFVLNSPYTPYTPTHHYALPF